MDEIIAKIKIYLKIINPNIEDIEEDNTGLVDFAINETLDRVQLYLNSDTIPTKLERILAGVVDAGLTKALKRIELATDNSSDVDRAVTSISDNGQSISYANEVTRYFTTASDEELFSGFASLLSRYRRIKVVYPKINDENDG